MVIGSLNNKDLFIPASVNKCWLTCSLVRACFLVHKGHLLAMSSHGWEKKHSLSRLSQGINGIHEGPMWLHRILITSQKPPPPTPITLQDRISTYDFWENTKMQPIIMFIVCLQLFYRFEVFSNMHICKLGNFTQKFAKYFLEKMRISVKLRPHNDWLGALQLPPLD